MNRPTLIGVDEAGRGPLAGPVVAGAVILPPEGIGGLADSKKLSPRRRAALEAEIKAHCRWAIGVVEPDEIDRLNILAATMRAMTLAVAALIASLGGEGGSASDSADPLSGAGEPPAVPPPVLALIDGNLTPAGRAPGWRWPARAIIGGDASEPAISAASIIAKEHRDRLMRALADRHPGYGWERNMGYGTAEHLSALSRLGPSPQHRASFAPVARAALIVAKG